MTIFPAAAEEVVDVELVLAVDVSLSMSPGELAIQRDGYAAAMVHDQVVAAIRDGIHGKIAVTYVEWAGTSTRRTVVPWMVIASKADAEEFARQVTLNPPASARRTSISGGLAFSARLFADSGYRGLKRVIDISGDGPNNEGAPVDLTRDEITATGITINGLPLMTGGGWSSAFDIKDLDRYYANCVIGGPGAFVIPVNDWTQFAEAVRRKLVLELALWEWPDAPADAAAMPVLRAQAGDEAYDCQVGEKIWRRRFEYWDN